MNIFALTGAGVSAESGLGTFRDKDGLWSCFDPMKLATPGSGFHGGIWRLCTTAAIRDARARTSAKVSTLKGACPSG